MKKTFLLASTLLIVILVGCVSNNDSPNPSHSPISTIKPNNSTEPPDITCVQISYDLPDSLSLKGQAVVLPQDIQRPPFFLDFSSGVEKVLPEAVFVDNFSLSPDQKTLAYFSGTNLENSRLIFVDNTGKVIFKKTVNRLQDWYTIISWINQKQIALENAQSVSNQTTSPASVVVFNPFTGIVMDLKADYPDMVWGRYHVLWKDHFNSAVSYNPLLTFVVYAMKDPNHKDFFALWDMTQQRLVATIRAPKGFGDGPVWSSDGEYFLIEALGATNKAELYTVTSKGEVRRVTYISEQYPDVDFDGPAWSPDKKYIAFWLTTSFVDCDFSLEYPDLYHLAVLDINNQSIMLFNITGSSELSKIIWSPDSKNILISVFNNEKTITSETPVRNIYDTYVLNINHGYAIKIADEATPIGWLK